MVKKSPSAAQLRVRAKLVAANKAWKSGHKLAKSHKSHIKAYFKKSGAKKSGAKKSARKSPKKSARKSAGRR